MSSSLLIGDNSIIRSAVGFSFDRDCFYLYNWRNLVSQTPNLLFYARTGLPASLTIQMPSSTECNYFLMTGRRKVTHLKEINLQGSNDGVTYSSIANFQETNTDNYWHGTPKPNELLIEFNTVSYKYFKVIFETHAGFIGSGDIPDSADTVNGGSISIGKWWDSGTEVNKYLFSQKSFNPAFKTSSGADIMITSAKNKKELGLYWEGVLDDKASYFENVILPLSDNSNHFLVLKAIATKILGGQELMIVKAVDGNRIQAEAIPNYNNLELEVIEL